MMPDLAIRPRVGLTLKRLFALAGLRSELTVSVPGTYKPGTKCHSESIYLCQTLQSCRQEQHLFPHYYRLVSLYDRTG
jgi:hypothetical protein